jgi:DNA-binding MarR family transcriptional regulator
VNPRTRAKPVPDLVDPKTPNDGALALQAVRALARASRLLERASGELNLAHYRVLSAIASGDERASRIAARLAIGKPTVSATVESLCRRGLLVRSRIDGDQRVAALHLTLEGERLLARVEAAMVERITDLGDRTPDGEQLLHSLVWMGAAIDDAVTQRHRDGG